MQGNILILTQPGDLHAQAIAELIRRKGGVVELWYTADYPSRATETIYGGGDSGQFQIEVQAPGLVLPGEGFAAIWLRRPAYVPDRDALHPSDVAFADLQCRIFRSGLLDCLYPESFWVNPRWASARANNKIIQHRAALTAGFVTPETLYTNDPRAVRSFLERHGGQIIFKSLWPLSWRDESTAWYPFTSLLTEEQLPGEEALRNCPGIFQELVAKDYELRVTVMGRTALGAKVLSQQTRAGKVDWRRAYDELEIEPFALPPMFVERCVDLLRALGLVFGCFDFVVTPGGEWVFLEVNQMGQFLFLDKMAKIPVSDAFSDFLLSGDREFCWQPGSSSATYADIEALALKRTEEAARLHVEAPEQVLQEAS